MEDSIVGYVFKILLVLQMLRWLDNSEVHPITVVVV